MHFLKIIFSEEKKFNFNGPDNIRSYWHHHRKGKDIFSRRQLVGGSLMVWAAYSSGAKLRNAFLEGRPNSHTYIHLLECHLLNQGCKIFGLHYVLQEDIASD